MIGNEPFDEFLSDLHLEPPLSQQRGTPLRPTSPATDSADSGTASPVILSADGSASNYLDLHLSFGSSFRRGSTQLAAASPPPALPHAAAAAPSLLEREATAATVVQTPLDLRIEAILRALNAGDAAVRLLPAAAVAATAGEVWGEEAGAAAARSDGDEDAFGNLRGSSLLSRTGPIVTKVDVRPMTDVDAAHMLELDLSPQRRTRQVAMRCTHSQPPQDASQRQGRVGGNESARSAALFSWQADDADEASKTTGGGSSSRGFVPVMVVASAATSRGSASRRSPRRDLSALPRRVASPAVSRKSEAAPPILVSSPHIERRLSYATLEDFDEDDDDSMLVPLPPARSTNPLQAKEREASSSLTDDGRDDSPVDLGMVTNDSIAFISQRRRGDTSDDHTVDDDDSSDADEEAAKRARVEARQRQQRRILLAASSSSPRLGPVGSPPVDAAALAQKYAHLPPLPVIAADGRQHGDDERQRESERLVDEWGMPIHKYAAVATPASPSILSPQTAGTFEDAVKAKVASSEGARKAVRFAIHHSDTSGALTRPDQGFESVHVVLNPARRRLVSATDEATETSGGLEGGSGRGTAINVSRRDQPIDERYLAPEVKKRLKRTRRYLSFLPKWSHPIARPLLFADSMRDADFFRFVFVVLVALSIAALAMPEMRRVSFCCEPYHSEPIRMGLFTISIPFPDARNHSYGSSTMNLFSPPQGFRDYRRQRVVAAVPPNVGVDWERDNMDYVVAKSKLPTAALFLGFAALVVMTVFHFVWRTSWGMGLLVFCVAADSAGLAYYSGEVHGGLNRLGGVLGDPEGFPRLAFSFYALAVVDGVVSAAFMLRFVRYMTDGKQLYSVSLTTAAKQFWVGHQFLRDTRSGPYGPGEALEHTIVLTPELQHVHVTLSDLDGDGESDRCEAALSVPMMPVGDGDFDDCDSPLEPLEHRRDSIELDE